MNTWETLWNDGQVLKTPDKGCKNYEFVFIYEYVASVNGFLFELEQMIKHISPSVHHEYKHIF